ncbi:MAG: replication initiation protein, partial [Rhodocyclaceae bacterium]|nr:replication initiation protein [Rhodocyclaceae bacterium]
MASIAQQQEHTHATTPHAAGVTAYAGANPDGVVRKHVNTIALMPTERRIGLLTRKLFNVMLRLAQQQGDTETYTAPLRELITLARFDSKDYQLLKRTLRQMISTVVEWQSPTDREFVRWEACGLVSGVSLSKPPEAGGAVILQWSYAPQIRNQLLSPERYARLSLELMTRLRSHTALALYEICARYIDNPSHLTARQPWRWWKPVLTGQPDREDAAQAQYRYFTRDVLLPAIAEVNALTDIVVVGPIEARGPDNKTITTIQFEVRRREEGGRARSSPPSDLVDLPVLGYAIRNGLSQAEAERLLEQYDATQ